jgi:polysaccharide biosynthesis protein PslE
MIEIRSLRDLLRLFFIFRREFQWAVIVTIVVALLGAFLLPTKYESNARLLVKPGRDNTTLPIEASNRQALIAPSTQRDPIVDEEKMLTGRPIVRMVAERYFEEMANIQPQGFWKTIKAYIGKGVNVVIEGLRSVLQVLGIVEEQTPVDRLAKKLEKSFSVGHEAGSAVIEISFTWDDPLIAQKVVDFWVEAFLEERTRALGRKSLYTFYEGEKGNVAEQITLLKEQLQGQLVNIDSIDVSDRLESLTIQINRLSDARIESYTELAGIRSFLTLAREQLKRQVPEVVTDREISLNPTQLDLKRQLNALNLERARLLRTFLADAPPVVQVEQNIRDIEVLVGRESERLERSQNRAPNSLVVSLKQQILDAELRERKVNGELKDNERQLAQLSETRRQVLANEPQLTRMTLELQAAEKSYALYTENLEHARIDRELDRSQISNIALIEEATFNPSRVFPKSLMILLLAIPAGFAVGLLTLYLCYLLDQRIHDGARIEEAFGVPLWSSMQDLGTPAGPPNSGFIASIYRLYGQLPLEQVQEQGLVLALTSARRGEGVSFILGHLQGLLVERGHQVRHDISRPVQPGEIVLLDASALLSNQEAFINLREADQIVLVVEAQQSTIPMIQSALSTLTTAFKRVDGIILNRRRFEVPDRVLQVVSRWRGLN